MQIKVNKKMTDVLNHIILLLNWKLSILKLHFISLHQAFLCILNTRYFLPIFDPQQRQAPLQIYDRFQEF